MVKWLSYKGLVINNHVVKYVFLEKILGYKTMLLVFTFNLNNI